MDHCKKPGLTEVHKDQKNIFTDTGATPDNTQDFKGMDPVYVHEHLFLKENINTENLSVIT